MENNKYGNCDFCGTPLKPVWFMEEELDPVYLVKTGRMRRACSHLVCPLCFRNFVVDDTFDGPWRTETI